MGMPDYFKDQYMHVGAYQLLSRTSVVKKAEQDPVERSRNAKPASL